ncbi:MAG: hypothetical protein ABIQ90_05575 [Polaromonas sp.]
MTKLDILTATHKGARQAIYFLRMESPEKEQTLMQTLGGHFGGEIVFVVDRKLAGNSQFEGLLASGLGASGHQGW